MDSEDAEQFKKIETADNLEKEGLFKLNSFDRGYNPALNVLGFSVWSCLMVCVYYVIQTFKT